MRLILEHHKNHRRAKRVFALFPISLNGEVRWLETVYLVQAYGHQSGWYNEEFITRAEWEIYNQD